jgi:hypothetical protein
MKFFRKWLGSGFDREDGEATWRFDKSRYPEWPDEYKPTIDAQGEVDDLVYRIQELFREQLAASHDDRLALQNDITVLNEELSYYEDIAQRQQEVAALRHYIRYRDRNNFFHSGKDWTPPTS